MLRHTCCSSWSTHKMLRNCKSHLNSRASMLKVGRYRRPSIANGTLISSTRRGFFLNIDMAPIWEKEEISLTWWNWTGLVTFPSCKKWKTCIFLFLISPCNMDWYIKKRTRINCLHSKCLACLMPWNVLMKNVNELDGSNQNALYYSMRAARLHRNPQIKGLGNHSRIWLGAVPLFFLSSLCGRVPHTFFKLIKLDADWPKFYAEINMK